MTTCSVCMDDGVEIGYECVHHTCHYQLCIPCIRRTFEDVSGANSKRCPECATPMAANMMRAVCGEGAVRAVENELRSKVEFDVEQERLRREKGKKAMAKMTERAGQLFNELSDRLNMQCPRCQIVFFDYDGCNALTCASPSCQAHFCAVCLQDCGTDAHPHVLQQHGDLFDRLAFDKARKKRNSSVFKGFWEEISDEPFEVQQLVKQLYDKSAPSTVDENPASSPVGAASFMNTARDTLTKAVMRDRLALLCDAEDTGYMRRGLTVDDISPRCVVPEDYQLYLEEKVEGVGVYTIRLRWKDPMDGWKSIPLPNEDKEKESKIDQDDTWSRPKVDSLANVPYTLRCGVVAFNGATCLYQSQVVSPGGQIQLGDDDVAIVFSKIGEDGQVGERTPLPMGQTAIIGMNQNLRMLLLEKHVKEKADDELWFNPLRVFAGYSRPSSVFGSVQVPAPPTFASLNDMQKKVAHPLALKTAMDVAGPPGTGKSYTITELLRSLLECTTADIIVLSERNGAIDAIAEKFADACLKDRKAKVPEVGNVAMWTDLMAFGASGVGPSTKLFTINEKLRYHPELVELRRIENEKQAHIHSTGKEMRKAIVAKLEDLDSSIPDNTLYNKTQLIETNQEPGLATPCLIVASLRECDRALANFLEQDTRSIEEKDVENLVLDNDAILARLISTQPKKDNPGKSWRSIIFSQLRSIQEQMTSPLLSESLFSIEDAEKAQSHWRSAQETRRKTEERLSAELVNNARVNMSTIGSSHKLPVASSGGDDDKIEDLVSALALFSLDNEKDTIVIIDEAGCIPSYEFLGLSRLGRDIVGLICVGDKEQLPPYDGSQFGGSGRSQKKGDGSSTPIASLLDVSRLTSEENGKILLTTQYRVPRDIAAVLNDRIYKGNYNTPDACGVPARGFQFVHAPEDRGGDAKIYVNQNEVKYCIELIRRFRQEGKNSILVLTPYKKQQRAIQFQLKRKGFGANEIPVLSIDQCQGQEADYVILSLVQKPTRFLNKNRLNVALSRVRTKLYFLADKAKFREASNNPDWDCSLIAEDLLLLDQTEAFSSK